MALASPLASYTSGGREFFDLVKAIGESKSKQEEDRIVAEEVIYLKKVVPQNTNKKKMKELVVRAMYVEMLGQDASFAYMKIVELCTSSNIVHKRAGYLAASLCLATGHEFRLMLVNRIQQDMKSTNQLDACAALSAVCKLVTVDMIPAVIGDVVNLMRHEMESVRKKAMGAMHRLYQMDKNSVQDHVDKIRRVLCDKDPSVMGASLGLLLDLCKDSPSAFKDLVPSLVSILKQVTEHKLPKDYDYHRIPAPWIQMHLLRILAVLGRGDQVSSEGMYEILADVMRRADTGINVGYAVVYETVNTVTSIYPNPLLLDAAATSISRFIRSDSHNLKYIGIKGLASIVKDHPRYAADHQMAVIDCLEDPDDTLKRKTLDLLFRMTNSVNVVFIAEKLLSFLSTTNDNYFRTELVGQISQCAERFAPSNSWYVLTTIRVLELAGDKVKPSVAQTLTQLIAEGGNDDDNDGVEGNSGADDSLRQEAVDALVAIIDKPKLPEILAQTLAWVLGEYGYLSTRSSREGIIDSLVALARRTADPCTIGHIVTALMKLVAQTGSCPIKCTQLVQHYSKSTSLDIAQRCTEFLSLLKHSDTLADVLPVDASCEDIDPDEHLSFLDSFVQAALAAGAKPYSPPSVCHDDDTISRGGASLRMTPYEVPVIPVAAPTLGIMTTSSGDRSGPTPLAAPAMQPVSAAPSQGNQLLSSKTSGNVWGRNIPPPAPAVSSPTPISSSQFNAKETPTVPTIVPSVPSSGTMVADIASTKQRSEKELMAAALFGGLGTSDPKPMRRPTGTAGAVPVATWSSAGATTPTPPALRGSSPVLLDMTASGGTPLAPNGGKSAEVTPGNNLLDMDIPGQNSLAPLVPPAGYGMSDELSGLTMISPAIASPVPAFHLPPAIFLAPLPLNTSTFGQRWGQVPVESKQSFESHMRSLEELRKALEPVGFHHVESIQASAEAIFSATAQQGFGQGQPVLVHIKINAARMGLDLTIRAASRDLGQASLSLAATALK